jgi:hypothetical protein
MNRNQVIIDGSNGTAADPCPSAAAQQDYTPRDGIVVWKASGVTIQNLTVCDYLSDANAAHGNEIWWNGGDGSGQIGMGAYSGSYLTATSEYGPTSTQTQDLAQYGIFVSNASGPGQITNSYASNMADAAYYIGGCGQVCNTTLSADIGTNSALGYSGTNSGGQLVIKNSLFTLNHAGVVPNSMNSEDPPPPQRGMTIQHNVISNNNNVNAPAIGFTAPVGIGVELAGGQYDTVAGNVITDQGSWGVATSDAPDGQPPAPGADCQGGIQNDPAPGVCDFPALGNLIYGNVFSGDGFFGNQTNSDLATDTLASYAPRNCFYGNADTSGTLTSEPASIQQASVDGKPCSQPGTGFDLALGLQMECALSAAQCPLPSGDANYPQEGPIVMLALPQLTSMPSPCDGVPSNRFCSGGGSGQ